MATFLTRFPQVRLWLASASAMGLMLGTIPVTYAQDIPTPTPPADGGEFEGAPDPTPGPEATPEPTTDVVVPETDESTPTESPDGGVLDDTAPDLPADGDAATGGSDTDEQTGDPVLTDSPAEDAETPADDVADDPTTEESANEDAANEPPATDEPVAEPATETPTAGEGAPPNNSPRGLW
ncbi:MAG: hypothetical protein AAGF93_06730 [Cyanobacteria bacterium P01_H01_bin.105]